MSDSGGQGYGTIIRMKFNIPGLFSWHCHLLSHEDHEMMRPLEVLPS
jgi:spore coat protein A, manganese oxidase